jgi:hypothetical protein
MCGPSKALKDLNNRINSFSSQVTQQANTVFGNDSQVFNNLMASYGKLVSGGPNQQGFDQDTLNRLNSRVIEQASTGYRNAKAAVGNATSAIGGGNEVLPSGAAGAENAAIANAAEARKSTGLTDVALESQRQGRENFFQGLAGEKGATDVFNNVAALDTAGQKGLDQAVTSQKNIDASSNWWQPLVMKGIGAAASFASAGLSNLGSGESLGEGIGDFFKGGASSLGNG